MLYWIRGGGLPGLPGTFSMVVRAGSPEDATQIAMDHYLTYALSMSIMEVVKLTADGEVGVVCHTSSTSLNAYE